MKKILSMFLGSALLFSMFASAVPAQAVVAASLAAEDFGVVNYDTGEGILKGYTAGFGLANATFADATSVVVKLYGAGDQLLQTNTLNGPNAGDITGTQISSPFDVSGTFNYVSDGYWTNVRATEYGQSVPAVKVVATVTLEGGMVLTAQNTSLVGDPSTIYPATKTLTVSLSGDGSGSVTSSPAGINCSGDCTEAYVDGTVVTLTATPASGSTFTGWSGNCSGTGTCSVTMSDAKSVTATFALSPASSEGPQSKDECKNGGWKNFTDPNFRNQGQCVSWFNHQQ